MAEDNSMTKCAVTKGPPLWRSCRYSIAVLSMFGFAITFLHRGSLSMAIVCMVNHTAVDLLHQGHVNQSTTAVHLTYAILDQSDIEVNQSNVNLLNEGHVNQSHLAPDLNENHVNQSHVGISNMATSDIGNGSNILHVREDNYGTCENGGTERKQREDGSIVWTKEEQGILLSSLYWSYFTFHLPGMLVTKYLGPKMAVSVSMAMLCLVTMLSPIVAVTNYWFFVVLRVLSGAACAVTIPSLFALWANWAPLPEKTRLIGLMASGLHLANIVVWPISSSLCLAEELGGWRSIFYLFGGVGVVWTMLWAVFMYNSPDEHPRISDAEKQYISSHIGETVNHKDTVPFKQMLTSSAFWAVASAQFATNFGVYLMLSNLALYMHDILKFDIKSNGVYSMLPYIATWIMMYVCGFLADKLYEKRLMATIYIRKLFICIGHMVPAVLLVILSFLDCNNVVAAVCILVTAIGTTAFGISAIVVNYLEIAPRFYGQTFAVGNFLAQIPGILTAYLVGELTANKTREEWQIIFIITAAVYGFGTLIFLIFASATLQPWASLSTSSHTIEITPLNA